MTILLKEPSEKTISIQPRQCSDGFDGQLWTEGIDNILVEGWDDTPGCAGAVGAIYTLKTPALIFYDDPFCRDCSKDHASCDCDGESEYFRRLNSRTIDTYLSGGKQPQTAWGRSCLMVMLLQREKNYPTQKGEYHAV